MKFFAIYICLLFPLMINTGVLKSQILTRKIVDVSTKQAVAGAKVQVTGSAIEMTTDASGEFVLTTGISDPYNHFDYVIHIHKNQITWSANKPVHLKLSTVTGQSTGFRKILNEGSGIFQLPYVNQTIYILHIECNGKTQILKLIGRENSFVINQKNQLQKKSVTLSLSAPDTLIISRDGYYTQKYAYIKENQEYPIVQKYYPTLDYLDCLPNIESFRMLQGTPLTPVFGEVRSVKIVYSIADDKLYYTNSAKYNIHYDFAMKVLGYAKGQLMFNEEQYTSNPNRIYYLANLNYFTSSGIMTLEFFPGDEIDCNGIRLLYNKIIATSYFSTGFRFYNNNNKWKDCTGIPVISSEELYEGQNYQPLNPQENYGYLKKINITDLGNTYSGRHDLVLLNGIPLDIPVVAGIITTDFQTPLSHINVLSHNRGTPNMALRDGWDNPKLTSLIGKLVYLKVGLDSFYIREASLSEAELFWSQKEPQAPHYLSLDTTTKGILNMKNVNINSVKTVGGKVANMGELAKITVKNYGPLPIPEGVYGIPFHYYWNHLRKYGLHTYIDEMLKDTVFRKDPAVRKAKLKILADSIKKSPLDPELLKAISDSLKTTGFTAFRFRSSTNAEDIEGFNGAGLYDSYTGTLDNPEKPVDKAIKKTWASLWNFSAFEERDYFKIDHKTVAMGILVNRSYPAEAANGVVITQNIYQPLNAAITINVQVGEISIVKPEDKYLPDQILYYSMQGDAFQYLSHSTVPGMEGKTVMTDDELKILKDYCMAVHYHYCRLNFECMPLDIEFKVDIINGQRKIYIKQARLY